MKIWVKLISDGKIKRDFVYEKDEKLTYSRFFDYLSEIAQTLDIPTPVLLKTHIFNFAKFNHVKFTKKGLRRKLFLRPAFPRKSLLDMVHAKHGGR